MPKAKKKTVKKALHKKPTVKPKKPKKTPKTPKKAAKKKTVKKLSSNKKSGTAKPKSKQAKKKRKILQKSSNKAVVISGKRGYLHPEEVQDYLARLAGIPVTKIAKARGKHRDTINKRINKARKMLGELPAVENAKDALNDMVPDALYNYKIALAQGSEKISTNVLINAGALDLKPVEQSDDMIHLTNAELMLEIFKMVMETKDQQLISDIREIVGDTTRQPIDTTAEVIQGDPTAGD